MTTQKQDWGDYLCTGRYCQHETSDKHYVVDETFLKNLLLEHNLELKEKIKQTKFFKNGGSCFECCEYEEMCEEILSLLAIDEESK